MTLLKLNEAFSFSIERNENQVRMIVYKEGVENVCRKENVGKLQQFFKSGEGRLFKGRLQLHKNALGICVIVKGELAGIINNEELIRMIQ
jgi:hypothetical protein